MNSLSPQELTRPLHWMSRSAPRRIPNENFALLPAYNPLLRPPPDDPVHVVIVPDGNVPGGIHLDEPSHRVLDEGILRMLDVVVPHREENVQGPGEGGEGPEVAEVVRPDGRAGETRGVEWRDCDAVSVVSRSRGVVIRAIRTSVADSVAYPSSVVALMRRPVYVVVRSDHVEGHRDPDREAEEEGDDDEERPAEGGQCRGPHGEGDVWAAPLPALPPGPLGPTMTSPFSSVSPRLSSRQSRRLGGCGALPLPRKASSWPGDTGGRGSGDWRSSREELSAEDRRQKRVPSSGVEQSVRLFRWFFIRHRLALSPGSTVARAEPWLRRLVRACTTIDIASSSIVLSLDQSKMSAPTQKKAKISGVQLAETEPEGFLLYEGGKVPEALRSELTHVRVGPQVTEIPDDAFCGCGELVVVQLNEGLQVIEGRAFGYCTALRSVTLPSTVTKLGMSAFRECSDLVEVKLNEGLQILDVSAFAGCSALRSVTVPSAITKLGNNAFIQCSNLAEVQFNEGLNIIGECAFVQCTALRSMTVPSTVTKLDFGAFCDCFNLTELRFNEGLQTIGQFAFKGCTALRSVTLPSTVTKIAGPRLAFFDCSNLSEVIFLGGERLLNQTFLDRRLSSEEGILDQRKINEMIGRNTFYDCPLTEVKVSISWALCERMERLPSECSVSVLERIRRLPRLEHIQDGSVFACFSVVHQEVEQEDTSEIQDTNNETARSLYQVLQLIAFHELKEASILFELAMWKTRIEGETVESRVDCRVPIPDPAKSLIMEYCGFADFLEPVIEGV